MRWEKKVLQLRVITKEEEKRFVDLSGSRYPRSLTVTVINSYIPVQFVNVAKVNGKLFRNRRRSRIDE